MYQVVDKNDVDQDYMVELSRTESIIKYVRKG